MERAHGVAQDRLVKELWLGGVSTIDGANELTNGGFVDHLNDKFAKEPARKEDAHRPVAKGVKLAEVFCLEEQRSVANDWVVRYHNRLLQISKDNRVMPKPKQKVTLRCLLDGTLQVVYQGQVLRYREIQPQPAMRATELHQALPQPAPARAMNTPSPTHPWRQSKLFPRGHIIGASRP